MVLSLPKNSEKKWPKNGAKTWDLGSCNMFPCWGHFGAICSPSLAVGNFLSFGQFFHFRLSATFPFYARLPDMQPLYKNILENKEKTRFNVPLPSYVCLENKENPQKNIVTRILFIHTERLKSLEKKGKCSKKQDIPRRRKSWEKESIHSPAPVQNFSLPKKWRPQRKDFCGRYGLIGFYCFLYLPPVWKLFL